MKDFRDLQVWQKAHHLALQVYLVTKSFPKDELYSLTSQLRRSTVSVPSNIAEGCGREGDAELARFLQIAMGSASEAEYQIILARELGYLPTNDANELISSFQEVKRMISGLLRRLRNTDR
ncbi:MAG: four helix bundle protein [Planctomycetaceae bacterium]